MTTTLLTPGERRNPVRRDTAVRHSLAAAAPLRSARIPLAKLRVHPRHIRRDMGDLAELAASLADGGQHQAITVERRGEFFQILDGHRRFGGATIARLRTLNAEIVPACTDADALVTMLATGVHSKPLSAAERGHAVRALLDSERVPATEVAARCGVSTATIRRWYELDDQHETTPGAPAVVVPRQRTARANPRPRRGPTTVGVTRVRSLADRWAEQCASGLSAAQAQELLEEIRALTCRTDHNDDD